MTASSSGAYRTWPVSVGFVFWGTVAAVLLAAFAYLVDRKVDHDGRRETRCAALGGYIDDGWNSALCRDRKTNSVLATWDELSDDATSPSTDSAPSGGTS